MRHLVKSAEMVESGSSLTLADASTLTYQDIRFLTKAYITVEKLCGWSVAVNMFHGVATPLAHNVQATVMVIGPCLHHIISQMADTPPSAWTWSATSCLISSRTTSLT